MNDGKRRAISVKQVKEKHPYLFELFELPTQKTFRFILYLDKTAILSRQLKHELMPIYGTFRARKSTICS